MISKVCIVVALIALIIYLYGVLITITTQEKNTCEMTYMFEYPQFVVSKIFFLLHLQFYIYMSENQLDFRNYSKVYAWLCGYMRFFDCSFRRVND